MREAINLAKKAKQKGDYPFGAVVVKDDTIIATGMSEELTKQDVTKHAELSAISQASSRLKSKDLSDCEIYTSGEPCNMCTSAIFQARIKKISIGATRSDLAHFFRKREIGVKQLAKDSSYSPNITTGLLNKEAKALFDGVVQWAFY